MTTNQTGALNAEALYSALDRRRRQLRISGRELLLQAGINSPATWTRLGRGREISVDTFLRLLAWLGETNLTPYSTVPAKDRP